MALSTLRIIVFGEEWTGKSSVGNIILGKKTFDVNAGTQWNSLGTGEVHTKSVVVVDSPGWDPSCSEATPLRVLADACHSLGQYGPNAEPHALLLTIPVSMDPEWNQRIARRLERLFSPRIWRQTILLFTRPSCLNGRSIEYHLENAGRAFQALLERCGNRYHTCTEDHKEVTLLLEKIEKMVEENCGECLNTKNVVLEMREQYDVRMERLAMSCNQSKAQLEQLLREQEELKLHCGPHIGLRNNEDFTNMEMSKEESAFVEHEGGKVVEEQMYQKEDIMCLPELSEYVGDKVPQQPALSLVSTEWNSATVQKVKGSGFLVTRPEPPKESMEKTLFINVDMEIQNVRFSIWFLTFVKRHHGSKLQWEMIWTFAWWQMVVVNRYKEISGIQRNAILPGAAEPPWDYMVDGLKKETPLASVKSCDSLPEIKKGNKKRKQKCEERRPHKRQRSRSLQRDYHFVKDLEDGGKKWKREGLKRSESCERMVTFGKPDHSTGPERGRKSKIQDPVPRSRSHHQNCPPWIQPNSSCQHA
ncbi:uncharacterized protein LOC124470071 isoform X2 [Hypomesus transpacificus]|uniref:uncharacterized protein LOC124470071 isoform X2 n=1 Tax=Hypomesus transpacificus TaxID=137520 RepID=UPI001F087547|nr:uncharacterized protein LOC124470071 isoform X2 [Hypomesus transpacificus]